MTFRLPQLTDCQDRLKRDFVEFAKSWAVVKEDWQDQRCQQFEKDHLTTLGPCLNRFAAALNEFSDVVRQAESQLADDLGESSELE